MQPTHGTDRRISNDAALTRESELLVLVFQGGGALGSYQGGVFEAMERRGARPDWVSGISIGAINAALVAGNPPGKRASAVRRFWEEVSSAITFGPPLPGLFLQTAFNEASAASTALYGVPGFFKPRFPPTYLVPDGNPADIGYYDTRPLRATLERLVDFDLLNDGETRVSLGAVNVATGNFRYFDTAETRIGPEHVMASGALPPGFPPVEIEGEWYWDGGLVSNTPLQYVLERDHRDDMCIFQVDLFAARGPLPRTIFDVAEREKDIRFSSRTRFNTDVMKEQRKLKRALHRLLDKLPAELAADPDVELLSAATNDASVTIVHLINRRKAASRDSKDYEFSRRSVDERWRDGFGDAEQTLDDPRFVHRRMPPHTVAVLDLTGD
ncbi:patatin-like phospholipase family protein [Jiella sonneratiae]|uniref:Patatin-like phospholipase family protein n=1 Tax=Jiella sonneratiae TaxID=2816856 RepID=A0ABS3J3F9_9HYPH|nr:patatin-like phospholipase family protein [Jiella sonneratiae]MBO0904188.1 patatin-like phospholipase family protein [Jiella sonneratiae]